MPQIFGGFISNRIIRFAQKDLFGSFQLVIAGNVSLFQSNMKLAFTPLALSCKVFPT